LDLQRRMPLRHRLWLIFRYNVDVLEERTKHPVRRDNILTENRTTYLRFEVFRAVTKKNLFSGIWRRVVLCGQEDVILQNHVPTKYCNVYLVFR
jgi:hypothetical protein